MDFPERLRATIKRSGLKREEFAERAGKSRGQLFKYLGGESAPTADFFQAIKSEFPWVNIEWLITGEGEMDSRNVGVHQVAAGNGHIQVGGSISGQVVGGRGNKVSTGREKRADAACVDLDEVIRVLEDYVSPKVIEEIRERLKAGR